MITIKFIDGTWAEFDETQVSWDINENWIIVNTEDKGTYYYNSMLIKSIRVFRKEENENINR
jgi:hypothetical protein